MVVILYVVRVELENIILTNDHLNNENFVSVIVTDENTNEISANDISIDDLLAALKAFDKQRKLINKRNKRYSDAN